MDFVEIEMEESPRYFGRILDLLISLKHHVKVPDQRLDVFLLDFGFVKAFSMWLEMWDYTSTDDEESTESLRCIVTSLKLIWPKEFKALSLMDRLARREKPLDDLEMKDFHSAAVELEAKIQQTKGHVECCTQILMRSSVQFKSSTFSVFEKFLWHDMIEFYEYKAAKIVPLKKQILILNDKILLLHNSFYGVDCMAYGEKFLPILNFIGDFAKSALQGPRC